MYTGSIELQGGYAVGFNVVGDYILIRDKKVFWSSKAYHAAPKNEVPISADLPVIPIKTGAP